MANLFRREVFESHRQAWLGTVQLTRPVPLWVATGFVLAVAVLVFAFLSTAEYARKARVTGFLTPDRGVIRLMAPQAATVIESRVREGQQVREGDTLFVLWRDEGTVLASEPFDDDDDWQEIPDRHLIVVDGSRVEQIPLKGSS